MKDTECRKQIKDIKFDLQYESDYRNSSDVSLQHQMNNLYKKVSKIDVEPLKIFASIKGELDLETQFRCDRDISLQKVINSLNSRMSKTEKQVKLLNTIIDRHSNEVLNTRVKLDRHVDEQVGALANSVTPKRNAAENIGVSYNPLDNMEISMGSYPCYASSSELEKDAVIKKLKCLGTVYNFDNEIMLKISPENLIKVNIHEYVASCNYRVIWIGIHTDNKNIQIDFRRNGE